VRLFALTGLGEQFARSTRQVDSPAWRIINQLDKRAQATDEQISLLTGLDMGTTMATLRHLKSKKIVREIGREDNLEL
jgi:transcription initiation factor IIE alpha subunit